MCFTFSRAAGSLVVWRVAGQLGNANRWSHRCPLRRFRQERLYGEDEGQRRVRIFRGCNRHVQSRCGDSAGHLPGRATLGRHRRRHTQPYLKLLLPGAELKLNEEMNSVALQRGAVEEKFDSLSLGTREQLAVLTRLALQT